MNSSWIVLLIVLFLGSLATEIAQTSAKTLSDVNKSTQAGDGKIVIHQDCNSGPSNEEVSSLKKEVEMLRKEMIQRFDNLQNQGKKDPWTKLSTIPVCFGAKDDQFGKFFVPSGGKLLAIKLVHLHGYVTCDNRKVYHWSYWGCGSHSSQKEHVDVAITTSANGILLPASQFITSSTKWSKIPGYNSLSPELVLSVFSNPLTVTSGQELRLWYGEDLVNASESDNGGKSCCEVYARVM